LRSQHRWWTFLSYILQLRHSQRTYTRLINTYT
jgi:hypothetical protein